MHDTAFKIGGLAIKQYCPSNDGEILEIGSLDVNGSLRSHSFAVKRYVGLDFSPGTGVDHVISDSYDWPVEDASFDLVLASSVFEHDPLFWQTFLVMLRKVKPGGYIYINAPANGWVHRYPLDCWRFYPDSGVALAKWALEQGVQATLVESFTAQREGDVWNDWCCVFRREPASTDLPEKLICDSVESRNVITWKSEEILRYDEQPEDMKIITQERDRRVHVEQQLVIATAELRGLVERENLLRSEVDGLRAQVSAARDAAENALTEAKEVLAKNASQIGDLEKRLQRANQAAEFSNAQLKKIKDERDAMAEDLRRSLSERQAMSKRLHTTTVELSKMAGLLKKGVADQMLHEKRMAWMRSLFSLLLALPAWWGVLPRRMRHARLESILLRKGMFDGPAYLQRYPDVALAAFNPLEHFIAHGISEGRVAIEQEEML